MDKAARISCVTLVIFLLAACSTPSECSSVVDSAKTCSGTIETLDGGRNLTYETGDLNANVSVSVDVTISVGSGRVDVSFRTVDGRTQRGEARPGSPVRLRGEIVLDANNDAVISLRSNGGAATQVGYTVKLSG
jgi:hypothetical protein